MSAWRRKAMELLPAHRRLVEQAASPSELWAELGSVFQGMAEAGDERGVRAVLNFAFWCLAAPASGAPVDTREATFIGFFEDLGKNEKLWPRLHEWLSPAQFEQAKGSMGYFLSPQEAERLEGTYYRKPKYV